MLKPVLRPFRANRATALSTSSLAFLDSAALVVAAACVVTGCSNGETSSAKEELPTITQNAEPATTLAQVTLSASRDTSVRDETPNRNYGTDQDLELNRVLVGFDTEALRAALGPEDYLVSASLALTLTDNDLRNRARARTVKVFRLTRAWTENGATYNCAIDAIPSNHRADCSGKTAWSTDDQPYPWAKPPTDTATIAPRQSGEIDFDVTADARGFISGSLANEGWMLKGHTLADLVDFASRETESPPVVRLSIRRCSPALCDDGNACTDDSCDDVGICTHAATPDGSACDDGNACTVGDTCSAGVCKMGSPKICAGGEDGCHPGVCDPGSGACSNPLACQLVGVGSVPASALDGLDVTPLTLPDGIAHNQIGGFGSAIAYTGAGNLYLVAPDRGPDNGLVGFTDRFYQVELSISDGVVTTLFRGGATLAKSAGDPFLGLNSAFDRVAPSEGHRLDPEGLRVGPNGTFFVSDEYGPSLYEFDATGNRIRALTVPPKFLVAEPGIEDAELPPTNTSGRQANRGMEGLAISPDGSKLYGIMQSPLIQDGALSSSNKRSGTNNRILEVDVATGATREFLYQLDDKDYGVNEILAVNDHQFLVLERDGDGGTSAKFKRLFLVDLVGATDISEVRSLPKTGAPVDVQPVSKAPFLDLLAPGYGLAGATFPEKIEGIAFGPDQADGSHLLIITQDNDFLANQPSRIFAFAIAPAALPGWQSQRASFSQACVTPSPVTCATTDACRHDGMCNPGTASCTPPALPKGTVSSVQMLGDCLRNQCDGQGNVVAFADDVDVPADDDNSCTTEVCTSGAPSHPPAPAGNTCNQSGGAKCDGAGACVSCLTAADCPGSDTECTVRVCNSGSCGRENLPNGTPVSTQTKGDCHQNRCDGFGGVTSVVDDTDLPADANPCTTDLCSAGVASNPPAAAGSSCGGANVCDGAGSCAGCVAATDCPGVDTECAARACTAGVCGMAFAATDTVVRTQTAGDCRSNRCDGAGNVVSSIDDTDVFVDGNTCTTDACTGGVASNALAAAGTACSPSAGRACDAAGQCVAAFMVVRMGSGAPPALTAIAAAVFVDEYTTGGSLLRTITLPTTASGSQRRFVNSGQASSEGALALSYPKGKFVTLAGYDADPGTTGVAGSASVTTNRVVARIDAAGNVDTSTAISNSFSGNNVRGAVSDDEGLRFWVSGASGGVQLVDLGGATSSTISSNLANVRTLEIFGGQLYGAASSGSVFNNIFTVGTGLPTTSVPLAALLGFPATGASPFAFVFIDANTLYVADDRAAAVPPILPTAGGGIQKWTSNGTGWTLSATFTAGLGVGVRGLAGYRSDEGVVLVATTADAGNPSGQHIVKFVDNGSETPPATTIVDAKPNTAFRGVTLPPL